MLTINQIHPEAVSVIENLKNINNSNEIENIFQANNIHVSEPDNQLSDIFTQAVDPVFKTSDNLSAGISQLSAQGTNRKSFAPEEMLALQMAIQNFSGSVTVLSKVVSLAIKFVNEMTHLQ
jgi:hypothetical protein